MYNRLLKEEETFLYVASKINMQLYKVNDYHIYMYNILLNIAISKFNFDKAREAALKLISYGQINMRIKTTQSKLYFYTYCIAKRIKQSYLGIKVGFAN